VVLLFQEKKRILELCVVDKDLPKRIQDLIDLEDDANQRIPLIICPPAMSIVFELRVATSEKIFAKLNEGYMVNTHLISVTQVAISSW
jgi:hypothetical protein